MRRASWRVWLGTTARTWSHTKQVSAETEYRKKGEWNHELGLCQPSLNKRKGDGSVKREEAKLTSRTAQQLPSGILVSSIFCLHHGIFLQGILLQSPSQSNDSFRKCLIEKTGRSTEEKIQSNKAGQIVTFSVIWEDLGNLRKPGCDRQYLEVKIQSVHQTQNSN